MIRSRPNSMCRRRHLVRSLQRGDGRRIVEIDMRIEKTSMACVKSGHSSSCSLPVRRRCESMPVSCAIRRLHHLLVGHFQRKDGDMLFMRQRGVLGNRKQKAGFTLTRTTCDDEQVGGLQARQHFVEVDEAGRHTDEFPRGVWRGHQCGRSNRSARHEIGCRSCFSRRSLTLKTAFSASSITSSTVDASL